MVEQLSSVSDVFAFLPSRFDASAAAGIDATYQFDLTGVGGGTYHIRVTGGQCEISEGAATSPNITITMTAADYLDMINGLLDPNMAFMGRKLRIKGDLNLALKMQQLFPAP